MKRIDDVTVVIISGGQSSRYWPLPHKMMVPFLGKSFLRHQIEMVQLFGFSHIVLVKNDSITEEFDSSIVTVNQVGDGCGAAILSAADYIKNRSLLVFNPDDVISPDLFTSFLKNYHDYKNILVGYKTKHYFPGGYLVLEGKQVAKVVEKPGEGNEPSNFVRLMFDYFHDAHTFVSFLEKNKHRPADGHYEDSLSDMIKSGEKFEMLEYDDVWLPVKFPWHTLSVMDHYLGTIKKSHIASTAHIHKTASITGPVIIEKNVRVLEYAKLVGPLYIGADTIIGNHTLVRHSMIGESCVVGFSSDVTRSYLGNNVWLHSNYVGDSVLSSHSAMGAGSILANLRLDEGDIYSVVKGQRINTHRNKLGGLLGEGARVGVGVHIMPGVKLGKKSMVGAGVLLHADVPDASRCITKQEQIVSTYEGKSVPDREQFRKKI